jgi:hypothetical protein
MKHLQLFEDFDMTNSAINRRNFLLQYARPCKIEDFLDIPYWRYANSQVDSIMKVEFLDNDKEGRKWNSDYRFTFFRLNDNGTFFEHIDKNNFLYQIMNLDIPEKILRPATDEEIEIFKGNILTRKFNI